MLGGVGAGVGAEAGEALAAGVGGATLTTAGWAWDEDRAARASASERWLANVFWDCRIFRTAGVVLWLAVRIYSISWVALNLEENQIYLFQHCPDAWLG